MELYSVLLADDEEEVVRIIRQKIDWEGLGFRVCGCARNGAEALEMAEDLQPDVVMTDIKMPYIDGLALSRELKTRYPDIRIIIFSGFDEFEYAKEAIRIEVEEYMLKPVDADELSAVFGRLKRDIDRERDERRNLDLLRRNYLQSLPVLRENFAIALIEGRVPEERLERYLDSYQIQLSGPFFVAAVLHVSGAKRPDDMDSLLFTVSVRQLVDEQLRERYRLIHANYLGDLAVIGQLSAEAELTDFTDAMDLLCRQAKRMYDVGVTAGIGTVCARATDIRASYRGASSALAYRAIYGNARAISISEVDPGVSGDDHWERSAARSIMSHMRMGDYEAMGREIDACTRRLREGGSGIYRYQSFMMELVTLMTDFAASHQLDAETLLGGRSRVYRAIFESESPEETGEWLKMAGQRIYRLLQERRCVSTTSFVSRAEEYVRSHYADADISIEAVCRHLGVSSAYFSTVFKKETGKTFIGYLTDYRMERAVELLMTTADRTYMIADKVGYSDSNYFSYVFKKQYGLSPSKFRIERQRGAEAGQD